MQDSLGSVQKPLHSGVLASPHAVLRHSQAPPEVTAEQCPPLAHVPSHRWSFELKLHGPAGCVVVVVVEVTVSGPSVAAAHRYVPRLKVTILFPPSSSVICAAGGNGFGQNTR